MSRSSLRLSLAAMLAATLTPAVDAQTPSEQLVETGAYVARAADCMSCHIAPDGTPYAGGKFIETPLGDIMATNITPSDTHGIGRYSEADFTAVLREGKAPDRMLYPAMPYPSYHGVSDDDIQALFAYMQTVDPVDRAPDGETNLDFPFNMRFLMRVWNAIAIEDDGRGETADAEIERGAYLVDHLGHCGTCHTPRNAMMMSDDSRYLGGTMVQGWEAPNITSDPVSGLGNWSDEDIVQYLKTGRAMGTTQAAGPMAEVVHFSTRYMQNDDLMAMARYLKTVPALTSENQSRPVTLPIAERPELPPHQYNSIREELAAALVKADLTSGQSLYLTQCAACHGVNGEGQSAAYYPALIGNADLRRDNMANLVNVIALGSGHATLYRAPKMPGFSRDLDDGQIAEIANYARVEFGGVAESDLSASDVNALLNPEPDLSFLIKYAGVLAWLGILIALVLVGALIWWIVRRNRNSVEGSA
ncbi:c-type cytochrome [Marivita sp. S2033]|uniref:c-type cytochrome n=1 Tax=Marivita sp. S2033 TaxID=3373187 RepID=UPI0039820D8F